MFTILLVVPLLWRQRRPMPVFLVLAAVAFAQWLADVKVIADVALLIALYTVAVQESRRRALFAAAVLEFGAILAVLRWSEDGWLRPFVALSALIMAAGVLGTSVRHRRALLASLEDRAARLELERDQQGLLAAAAERARIAREMHDIVAHNLTVMIALADGAVFAAERAPEKATTAMETVSATGRQALDGDAPVARRPARGRGRGGAASPARGAADRPAASSRYARRASRSRSRSRATAGRCPPEPS